MTSAPYPTTGAGDVDELLGNAYRTVLEVRDNLPLIASIQLALDDISTVADNLNGVEGAILANHVAMLMAGFQNYRATFAEAVADLPVGSYFTSIEGGTLRLYKRVAAAPYYEDQGDGVAPLTKSMFAAASGSGLIGVTGGGTLADKLIALDNDIAALETSETSQNAAIVALSTAVTELENAPAPVEALPTVASTAAIVAGNFPVEVTRIATMGFTAANDGGAAVYTRWVAGMAALAAGGQNIWWFTAADGSKWQIDATPFHMAAQFGALGGNAIDVRPIINTAFAAPTVRVINLGTPVHYMSGATTGDYSIKIPSGKGLCGITPEISWVKLNPVTLGAQTKAIQTICFEDDIGGFAANFSLDCQRSGAGGGMNDRVSGLTVRAKSGNGRGTRVDRVNVYNATGYGHYESADATRTLRDIERRNCKSVNCGVGFEDTGNVEVKTIDCIVDCSTTVWDGGAIINCEAMYHEYGAISRVERVRCVGYGQAGAGFFPVTVGADIGTIIYRDCYAYITNAVPALRPLGQGTYVIHDLRVYGGEFVSANSEGCNIEKATMKAWGTRFSGAVNANSGVGNGAGVSASTGAVVDLFDCDATGRSNTTGGSAAYGLLQQDTGVVRVHGGKYEAVGPAGLMNAIGGTVTQVTPATLTPVPPVVAGPSYVQMLQQVSGQKTAAQMTNAGYTVPPNYWFDLVMPQPVVNWNKVTWDLMIQRDNNNTTGPDWSASYRYMSATTVQVFINAPGGLTDCTLHYTVTERA